MPKCEADAKFRERVLADKSKDLSQCLIPSWGCSAIHLLAVDQVPDDHIRYITEPNPKNEITTPTYEVSF